MKNATPCTVNSSAPCVRALSTHRCALVMTLRKRTHAKVIQVIISDFTNCHVHDDDVAHFLRYSFWYSPFYRRSDSSAHTEIPMHVLCSGSHIVWQRLWHRLWCVFTGFPISRLDRRRSVANWLWLIHPYKKWHARTDHEWWWIPPSINKNCIDSGDWWRWKDFKRLKCFLFSSFFLYAIFYFIRNIRMQFIFLELFSCTLNWNL